MQTVDATTTMVADVTMDVAITETEFLPASGSFYCSSSAVDAEMVLDAAETDVDAEIIVVSLSFCFLSSVEEIH